MTRPGRAPTPWARRPASVIGVVVEAVGVSLAVVLVLTPLTGRARDAVAFAALFGGVRLAVGLLLLRRRRDEGAGRIR